MAKMERAQVLDVVEHANCTVWRAARHSLSARLRIKLGGQRARLAARVYVSPQCAAI